MVFFFSRCLTSTSWVVLGWSLIFSHEILHYSMIILCFFHFWIINVIIAVSFSPRCLSTVLSPIPLLCRSIILSLTSTVERLESEKLILWQCIMYYELCTMKQDNRSTPSVEARMFAGCQGIRIYKIKCRFLTFISWDFQDFIHLLCLSLLK